MEINPQTNSLPGFLKSYENTDFAMQQKARFFYRLCQVILVFLVFIFFYTGYVQTISLDYDDYFLPVLFTPLVMGMIVFLCMILLRRGKFMISTHILVLMSFSAVWTVMFIDKSGILARLDTLILIPAIISMLPLIVKRAGFSITVFTVINILLLIVFLIIVKDQFNVPKEHLIDIFSDSTIAFVFIAILGYNIYIINAKSLEKTVNDIRQRHEAEKALYESEKKYSETLDLLPQTVFEADINGRLLYVNKKAFEDFGYSSHEMESGLFVTDMIIESERDIAATNLGKLMRNERKESGIYTAIRKDGTTFPVQIYNSLIKTDDKITGFRGILVDISRQVESEKAIQESESRYRALMESMNEIIIVADNEHRVEYVNRQFSEVLGYTRDEIIGRIGYKILHDPEDQKKIEEVNNTRLKNQASTYELTFRTKGGERIDFLVSGAPYKNANGEITGSIGALMNITARKAAEKALKESQQLFQTLAQNSPVGIFRTTTDGSTIYVNPKWSEISGLSFEEALGNGWFMAVHPEDRIKLQSIWEEDITERKNSISEYRFLKKDGTINWVLGNAVPEIVEGELIGYIGTITNISEIKNAQKELRDNELTYRKMLETQVKERTEELALANEELQHSNIELLNEREKLKAVLFDLQKAQNQLVHSEKMASLGILAAGVAHEINNPLNFIQAGIFGLSNYFEEKLESHVDEVKPLIDGIKEGVRRASNIVTSLNQYSRYDERPRTNCDIHHIIDNCLVMLQNETRSRIKIIREFMEENHPLKCNEGMLHQAVLNILANSVQAIGSEGIIKISTKVSGDDLVVTIADNGCGIDKKNIDRIFDPFFTTKEAGKGTGLGLSITYNIIKELNGTIHCSSKKHEGTEFIINLPLKATVTGTNE